MDSKEFIYWVSGVFEYNSIEDMDEKTAKNLLRGIKDHLELVLTKVTPIIPGNPENGNEYYQKRISGDPDFWKKAMEDFHERHPETAYPFRNPIYPHDLFPYTEGINTRNVEC